MDISSLRERSGAPMSVGALNEYIKTMFDTNRLLSSVSVCGEISNFTNHRSGHLYFSLKDGEGQIRAVMFRSSAARLKFIPENGMRVIAHGSVSVYAKDGSYQLYVNSLQPDGVGALYLAYEQLKLRLEAEGFFDRARKKPIPEYPTAIGVVTSPTGAAVRDVINVLGRRYPLARVYVYPALVQGAEAEESLIRGIDYFDSSRLVDTVIIGRGGGSIEDLWAFNGERLARRIYDCNIPVISAVGHETDFTICDFVSDLRAPTPSAAAELATVDMRDLLLRLDSIRDRCDSRLLSVTGAKRERLLTLTSSLTLKEPKRLIEQRREAVEELVRLAGDALRSATSERRQSFARLLGKLEGLNPLAVLSRGFSVVERAGMSVGSAKLLREGDEVSLRFSDGEAKAQIIEISHGEK